MAKKSIIQRNLKRIKISSSDSVKRMLLKETIYNKLLPLDLRIQAQLKLSGLRRDGSLTRIRNRCEEEGRGRGYYRKFKLCRIALRKYASFGQIPGMVKSSW